jgi:hypothetical protein
MHAIAIVALAAVVAANPTPSSSFHATVTTDITYAGGFITALTGGIFQNPEMYQGSWVDNTGYAFKESYLKDSNGCTNWEEHDTTCLLGCNKGTSCSDHTCSCGGAYGIFAGIDQAVVNGTCSDGSTAYQLEVPATDDDYHRAVTLIWCFAGSQPTAIHKTYHDSPLVHEAKAMGQIALRSDAPMHQRITNVDLVITAFTAGSQPSNIFYPPADCQC